MLPTKKCTCAQMEMVTVASAIFMIITSNFCALRFSHLPISFDFPFFFFISILSAMLFFATHFVWIDLMRLWFYRVCCCLLECQHSPIRIDIGEYEPNTQPWTILFRNCVPQTNLLASICGKWWIGNMSTMMAWKIEYCRLICK